MFNENRFNQSMGSKKNFIIILCQQIFVQYMNNLIFWAGEQFPKYGTILE